ncbi:hypothetical protein P7C73_g1455, partial [Tremellales sp. Uapishka_1]
MLVKTLSESLGWEFFTKSPPASMDEREVQAGDVIVHYREFNSPFPKSGDRFFISRFSWVDPQTSRLIEVSRDDCLRAWFLGYNACNLIYAVTNYLQKHVDEVQLFIDPRRLSWPLAKMHWVLGPLISNTDISCAKLHRLEESGKIPPIRIDSSAVKIEEVLRSKMELEDAMGRNPEEEMRRGLTTTDFLAVKAILELKIDTASIHTLLREQFPDDPPPELAIDGGLGPEGVALKHRLEGERVTLLRGPEHAGTTLTHRVRSSHSSL